MSSDQENRIIQLESTVAMQERALEKLQESMLAQQRTLDKLEAGLSAMADRLRLLMEPTTSGEQGNYWE